MMCSCRIPNRDILYRHSIHPVSFRGQAFAADKLFHFKTQPDGFEGSLAWERFLPTIDDVHAYGCRMARQRNELKKSAGTYKEKDRQIYAGAYCLNAAEVRTISHAEGLEELQSADVVHKIENGEVAHVSLKVVLKPGFDVDPEGTKTAVIALLWGDCQGPLKCACDYDSDIPNHPSTRLETPPSGAFSDQRSRFLRSWARIRFRFFDWFLRKILRCDGL